MMLNKRELKQLGMKIALLLTLSRIILAPIFVALTLYHTTLGLSSIALFWLMLAILIYAELSDIFDGMIARSSNQVTQLGMLLDPMSDSIFRMSVFFSFTQLDMQLPLLWVMLLFYRDSLVACVRNLCALKGIALGARKSGKLKAIIQGISSFLIVISYGLFSYGKISETSMQNLSAWVIAICAIYALTSGIEYMVAHRKLITLSLKATKSAQS